MTEPTKPPNPNILLHPGNILMDLIVAILAPMFLCVTAGDVNMARMAAADTVNAYRARNHADLIAIAQIIACGLAALGSLSLSMTDDISLSMTLRLRGNAVALNRSAEQNRRAVRESLKAGDSMPHFAVSTPKFETPELETPELETPELETPPSFTEDADPTRSSAVLNEAAAEALAAESEARLLASAQNADQAPIQAAPNAVQEPAEKRHQEMWAIAMVKEAAELTASIPNLPPAERQAATIRAAGLGSTANMLLTGVSSPIPRPPFANPS